MAREEQLRQALRAGDRRYTRQRQLVMEVLEGSQAHLDVEAVYALAKKRDPHISLPTVYRALAVLKEAGLVQDHRLGEDHAHFEAAQARHYHFTCLACGRVVEFDAPQVRQMVRELSQREGLRITDVHVFLSGYCAQCRG